MGFIRRFGKVFLIRESQNARTTSSAADKPVDPDPTTTAVAPSPDTRHAVERRLSDYLPPRPDRPLPALLSPDRPLAALVSPYEVMSYAGDMIGPLSADGLDSCEVTLQHGNSCSLLKIRLDPLSVGDVLVVIDLMTSIAEVTGVPSHRQRIVLAQRRLDLEPWLPLKVLNLHRGSLIRMERDDRQLHEKALEDTVHRKENLQRLEQEVSVSISRSVTLLSDLRARRCIGDLIDHLERLADEMRYFRCDPLLTVEQSARLGVLIERARCVADSVRSEYRARSGCTLYDTSAASKRRR